MAIKVKAKETLFHVGLYAGTYRYVLAADLYSQLSSAKVITEAALRSGLSKGVMNAAWEAIGDVISAWATEGHSVAIPGLGSMRFGLNAKSVGSVDEVSSGLITTRKVIFAPNSTIKNELKNTSISITCYDRNGQVIKTVSSQDAGEVEENDTTNNGSEQQGSGSSTEQGGSNTEQGGSSTEQGGSTSGGADDGMGD
ncbi:MAG: DNA-binding protein [Bacteroidaceae bacterium]|nr:DNA-binding protein [Bacteroidaceae bacterium]